MFDSKQQDNGNRVMNFIWRKSTTWTLFEHFTYVFMPIKSIRFVIQTHLMCVLFLRACRCRYAGYIAGVSEPLLSHASNWRGHSMSIIDFRTTYIYVYTPPLPGTRIYTGISPPLQRYTFRNLYIYIYIYIYVCVCVCVYLYVYVMCCYKIF